jgi:uncharacterized protein YqjF (DUF2071 family)
MGAPQPVIVHMLFPERPASGLLTVETTLAHFAIVTYAVKPEALRPHVHTRFELDTVLLNDGRRQALVSVVPFLDLDFRLTRCPWPRQRFGQTNYRAYVTDRESGEHVAWFFGTALDTFFVNVPRHAWKLPWHHARIRFDCEGCMKPVGWGRCTFAQPYARWPPPCTIGKF